MIFVELQVNSAEVMVFSFLTPTRILQWFSGKARHLKPVLAGAVQKGLQLSGFQQSLFGKLIIFRRKRPLSQPRSVEPLFISK